MTEFITINGKWWGDEIQTEVIITRATVREVSYIAPHCFRRAAAVAVFDQLPVHGREEGEGVLTTPQAENRQAHQDRCPTPLD